MNFTSLRVIDIVRSKLSKHDLSDQCMSIVSKEASLNINEIPIELISSVADTMIIPYCVNSKTQVTTKQQTNLSSYEMWIYGMISVTIINTCAVIGILFVAIRKKRLYKVVMAFMISLAVGSLAGSALLILIPDALQLTELQESSSGTHVNYKYKATVIFGGLYMFFLLERFLKWAIGQRMTCHNRDKTLSQGSINIVRKQRPRIEVEDLSGDINTNLVSETKPVLNYHCLNGAIDEEPHLDPPSVTVKDFKNPISSVAWMIIFGDAVHNFIDGLSIGAAFSRNLMTGISLSIAVLCEELPHELGDFAILLNAGMRIKQALMWNALSAATCYIGFIIGFVLGETTSGSTWIFAVAGGMFLYISLVDMMPEMNAVLENKDCKEIVEFGLMKTFVIQNIGLLIGYGILLIMALYGDKIQIN